MGKTYKEFNEGVRDGDAVDGPTRGFPFRRNNKTAFIRWTSKTRDRQDVPEFTRIKNPVIKHKQAKQAESKARVDRIMKMLWTSKLSEGKNHQFGNAAIPDGTFDETGTPLHFSVRNVKIKKHHNDGTTTISIKHLLPTLSKHLIPGLGIPPKKVKSIYRIPTKNIDGLYLKEATSRKQYADGLSDSDNEDRRIRYVKRGNKTGAVRTARAMDRAGRLTSRPWFSFFNMRRKETYKNRLKK